VLNRSFDFEIESLHQYTVSFTHSIRLVWHKHYNNRVPHAARELGSFWWKDVLRLNIIFRGIAKCELGDGSSVCFWDDLWTDSVLLTNIQD
jgi:hypothetical protein